MRFISATIAFWFLLVGWAFAAQEMTLAQAKESYRDMVVFIAVYLETPTSPGQQQNRICIESGSGFIISSEGYVITSKHLFRDKAGDRYKNMKVVAGVGSAFDCTFPVGDNIYEMELIEEQGMQDAALLRIISNTSFNWVPVCREYIVSDGSTLTVLGYPLGRELSARPAVLENKSGPRGMWQFDAALNAGNSGGPVFNSQGQLIGMVYGDTSTANNLSFFLPFQYFSPLYQLAQAPLVDCTTVQLADCDPVEVPYSLEYTHDAHDIGKSTWYRLERSFDAEDGFIIVGAEWRPSSIASTRAPELNIAEDKQSITFSADMESGPFFNQYRAWVRGLIITKQLSKKCSNSN